MVGRLYRFAAGFSTILQQTVVKGRLREIGTVPDVPGVYAAITERGNAFGRMGFICVEYVSLRDHNKK